MSFTEIRLEKTEEVAWITLYRPAKMNALTEVMVQEWRQALEEIRQDPKMRAVVVTGEGKAWSAGVDLSIFQRIKVEPGYQMWKDGVAIMEMLETIPQVTIAMVNGYCYTGALELLMAFDLIIAAEEAKFGDTHAKWGIPPKWGMTQRLAHQVGMRKAKELSFTAKSIDGKEAAAIGLVNEAVPLAQLRSTVESWLAQILQNSGQAIAAIKHLYHYGSNHHLSEGINYEKDYQMAFTDKQEKLQNFKKEL